MERLTIRSGIAGLGCAHFLQRRYDHIFEAADHIGGHSRTVSVGERTGTVDQDAGLMITTR